VHSDVDEAAAKRHGTDTNWRKITLDSTVVDANSSISRVEGEKMTEPCFADAVSHEARFAIGRHSCGPKLAPREKFFTFSFAIIPRFGRNSIPRRLYSLPAEVGPQCNACDCLGRIRGDRGELPSRISMKKKKRPSEQLRLFKNKSAAIEQPDFARGRGGEEKIAQNTQSSHRRTIEGTPLAVFSRRGCKRPSTPRDLS